MLDTMQLFLNDKSPTYHLTPLVVMNILNHYQRRPSDVPQNIKNAYPGSQIQACDYVLGLLFGTITDTDVHITDSFGIPVFENEGGSMLFSNDTVNDTIAYHMMGHQNDKLVGWYQTGLYITNNQALFHKMITKSSIVKLNKRRRISYDKALMLLIDTELIENKLNILGFTGKSVVDPIELKEYNDKIKYKKKLEHEKRKKKQKSKLKKKNSDDDVIQMNDTQLLNDMTNDKHTEDKDQVSRPNEDNNNNNNPGDIRTTSSKRSKKNKNEDEKKYTEEELKDLQKPESWYHRFDQVNLIYSVSSEQIAMDMIINAPPENNKLDAPSELVDDLSDLKYSLHELINKMKSVESYVQRVLNKELDGDDSIGWLIMECFNKIPNFSSDKFEEQMSTKLQDMLMLGYLGKLTFAQLSIADSINGILHQTIPKFDE